MVPKILILKTGERIIAGAGERKGEDGRGVCLVVKSPYILTLGPKPENSEDYTVNFSKWNPFSSTVEYNVPYDAVISVSDPEQGILDVYLERFGAEILYDEETNEQPETDIAEDE